MFSMDYHTQIPLIRFESLRLSKVKLRVRGYATVTQDQKEHENKHKCYCNS